MLADGTADVLVVAKLDRATRSVGDLCELLDLAARQGWHFVADDLGIDTATPMGRAMAQIAGVFSELERNLIAERTRSALAVRRSQGVRLGRPVNLPDRVRERIVTERALGSTLTGIADWLNLDGVPTSQGAPAWTHATVRAVLRSVEVDEALAAV